MSDRIAAIASATSAQLFTALKAALDESRSEFDVMSVRAVLERIEQNGISTDELRQLETALGLADGSLAALQTALERDQTAAYAPTLASLFAASAALAAAAFGHTINPNSRTLRDAGRVLRTDTIRGFVDDTTLALANATARVIQAPGDVESKIRHLYRSIGLSNAQSRSLDAMRTTIFNYLAAPSTAQRVTEGNTARTLIVRPDPERFLATTRGLMSAPQQAMLRKALANGMTPADAEKLLDRHANALLQYRAKVAAEHAAHGHANAGELAGWQAAQAAGKIPNTARRFWKTAGDERVRHAHSQVPLMNATGVPLTAPFKTPLGQRMTPPLEINCRCHTELRLPK